MTTTWWVVVGTAIVWFAYDLYAYEKWGNAGTISVLIDWLQMHFKALGFIAGFIFGHLFWQVHICP